MLCCVFACGFLVHAQVNENCLRNLLFIGLHSDCQTVLVELLVAMVSQRITAEELALLIRLFLEKTPPTVNNKPYQSLNNELLAYVQGVDTDSLCSQSLHIQFFSRNKDIFVRHLCCHTLFSLLDSLKLINTQCSPGPTSVYIQLTPVCVEQM